jgi:hypothetical protein
VLGRLLFRWRGVIGVVAFGVVFWLARPTLGSCLLGVPVLTFGLAVRFWASGYIGIEGRVREIGARRRIASGPYRILRHPLYIGNFVLVVGMVVALRPALWLCAVVVVGFVVEYAFIVAAEERYLASRRSEKPEARSESAEARMAERGRSQKSAVSSQMSEVAGQSPESMVDGRECFVAGRALVEWRVWVVTGVAWGAAVLRALVAK